MNKNGTASFMHSREGVTQVDKLSIVAYDIAVLPLIQWLKLEYSGVTQPWYSDDMGAKGTYKNIDLYFNSLKRFGAGNGY